MRLGRVVSQNHARELTTGEVSWRWIDTLTNDYGKDPDITAPMDSTEMWVVPIPNPDGIDIVAQRGDNPILHRTNADDSQGGGCGVNGQTGVDLNRNAATHWGGAGTSTEPCSDTHPGGGLGVLTVQHGERGGPGGHRQQLVERAEVAAGRVGPVEQLAQRLGEEFGVGRIAQFVLDLLDGELRDTGEGTDALQPGAGSGGHRRLALRVASQVSVRELAAGDVDEFGFWITFCGALTLCDVKRNP
ncbi:M14 family zinc carboxypeptidase [Streptomyces sp. NPDC053427]|uniref:M14 family zinc carboxypeptidase n=1 Tax=Streptomyces sp. NPDC053427 TaxID=3365701 RepID=UPI0037CE9B42